MFSYLGCEVPTESVTISCSHKSRLAQVAFLEGHFFDQCIDSLKTLVQDTGKQINLLIADAPYGCSGESWDIPWTGREFQLTLEAVNFCNPEGQQWEGTTVVWFLSDQQLHAAISVILEHGLSYRIKAWTKPFSSHSMGRRLRQHHELMLLVWKGKENDLVSNIDKNDGNRYSNYLTY